MGEIVYDGLCYLFGNIFLAAVIVPIALIFIVYLVYIIVMTIREFKK